MTDKMLDDLPNNMIKLIKVNDSKKKDPKEKDSDEDAFMDMFDDETRKLAENFDMFESANPTLGPALPLGSWHFCPLKLHICPGKKGHICPFKTITYLVKIQFCIFSNLNKLVISLLIKQFPRDFVVL